MSHFLFVYLKNQFAFGPALRDDERSFELLEEKGLLSLFSSFSFISMLYSYGSLRLATLSILNCHGLLLW